MSVSEKKPTVSLDEGPFYKAGSPERTKIAGEGTVGGGLVVEGRVLTPDGQPVSGAWLDFWHADGNGSYDNEGFNLRGHQFTDASGSYHLETVRPAAYGPRTAHIHVKVRAREGSQVLTSQLFFPGEEKNGSDPIFRESLLVDIDESGKGHKARFDFVVDTA